MEAAVKEKEIDKQAAVVKRVEQKAPDVTDAALAKAIAEMEGCLAARGAFAGRVDIRVDDQRGFVVDGPNKKVLPVGSPADCRFFISPNNLSRVARGALDPRMAILFGQLQMQDGPMRMAVAFFDFLADRVVTQKLETNRELPVPTTDWAHAREDLETFGYALIKDALSPEQVKMLRARVVEQAAGERDAGVASLGQGTQALWSLLNKGQEFHDLLLHPLVDEFVPDVLGEYPVMTGIVSIIAVPGGQSTTMHLDQSYVQPAVDFQIGLNILWFLDDVSDENGGTRIMPGSHKSNIAPADPSSPDGTIAAAGPAGTALLLDSRVWHATGNNRTKNARHVVVSYFNRSFMRTQENYFLSLKPEVEASLHEKVRVLCGFRCTGSLGAVEGPIEGQMNSRPANPVGELRPSQPLPD